MFFSFDKGDYLIHEKYGIGQFIGIESLTINNTLLDFFKIKYLNDSFLLIPSYNIGVFKFHSNKDSGTLIETLGKSSILKKQSKLKEEISKTAQELIEIYKARESIVLQNFYENDDYHEFCNYFEHELTKSQKKSITEINQDLSKTKPMDRLLCGDVGFGKTEVAARAIALTLTNNHKAIFIVPTTILASQHFESLKDRFLLINKKIAVLSKLNENNNLIKKKWLNSEIDLLITTAHHKGIENLLIEKLGLIVLDEEHHFGVKFKEKLRLKAHFLQLSATPIPRTLHLSLSKIKDISLLETPPIGRKDVLLNVCSLNDLKIEDLIKKEIDNNCKVFLVVPRVQYISEVEKLVSSFQYVVLHGQMTKDETNRALSDFSRGNKNILISTNIVESGVNILTANLMIVFYSHMFGIAQLHQLKGRVGRTDVQGKVYFIVPETIKEVAFDRINMIQQNSSLGGGFQLSMQDMEFRGTGTVVGSKQSGKDYGFGAEMYFDVLSECIEKTSKKKNENKIAWIGFSDATIPKDYINDDKIRFSFYKKLSLISNIEELKKIIEDLKDFGDIPKQVYSFLDIVKINLLSFFLKIKKVIKQEQIIEVFYEDIELEVFIKIQEIVLIDVVNKNFLFKDELLLIFS
ncbi:DEAD/DEAH box helicase [Alphaproteobacteria bacterium endosymbiont of Tiliacea citrago]|uniref:DEAD/DEAH box helicase n=1 Tax=Alphaproteobacteria bacterium endosymbiont of Tiliacea citrago TaxID=3077944 RepID=UPI00313D2EA5